MIPQILHSARCSIWVAAAQSRDSYSDSFNRDRRMTDVLTALFSQNELEERMIELKHTNEQNKKALNDTTRLSEELRQQEQNNVQTEKQRRLLEFQVKEFQARLEDVENHSVHGAQKTIEKLEQKVYVLFLS